MLVAAICALVAMLVIGGILYTYGEERAQVSAASQHLVGGADSPKKNY
jgi:archaellum component FlaF (FlaF/FlaG flagellin family)